MQKHVSPFAIIYYKIIILVYSNPIWYLLVDVDFVDAVSLLDLVADVFSTDDAFDFGLWAFMISLTC